ncbi:MAG: hypothetical protein AABX48_01105 [Nanoarchaeota archaeon]|mgnify:CR=1 FL=1
MNRNKLIEVFISNLANTIVHQILEKAAFDRPEKAEGYNKEFTNSWELAKRYREKINPINRSLPDKDIQKIKTKIANKVNTELKLRISKGYQNINLTLVEEFVDKVLIEMKVI